MNEIKVAENKTLKLTNVLSRTLHPEELANLPVILTQMQNFMKSNGVQPSARWCRRSSRYPARISCRRCT